MKTIRPKVSVIMPVYNSEKYVAQAIKSILQQTFKNFEFLILNDGSRDHSLDIIQSFNDPRIILINHKTNRGLIAVLNQGLKLARGRFIARMDADDISHPKRLELQIKLMEKNPSLSAVGGWVKTIGLEKNRKWQYRTNAQILKCELLFDAPLAHPTVMLRSATLKKHNLRYRIKNSEDYGLWNDLTKFSSIANMPMYLLQYRVHSQQTGSKQFDTRRQAAHVLRNSIVRRLVPNANKEELILHQQLATRDFGNNRAFLIKAEKWLLKIQDTNSKKNTYPTAALNHVLGFYWWQVAQCNSKQGVASFKIYKNSTLTFGYSPSKLAMFKFFIKCCFGQSISAYKF